MKIQEIEPQLAQRLGDSLKRVLHDLNYVLPQHYQIRVSLLAPDGRKKRSDASADNWSPESGRIEIRFEPLPEPRGVRSQVLQGSAHLPKTEGRHDREKVFDSDVLEPAEAELLRALDRAESKPGWNFVPWRKFRDEILPLEPFASKLTDSERRDLLDSVINKKRLVLTSKVTNPKSPQFPVTTVRLNRLMPQVKVALGQGHAADLDFHPVEIRGEPLSATVLRERR